MEIRYEIKAFISGLEDSRRKAGRRFTMEQMVVMILMAVLSGHQGIRGIERFVKANEAELIAVLGLKHGVPSYQTIQSMLHRLNAQKMAEKFTKWMSGYSELLGDDCISMDGKTLRSTVKNANNDEQNFLAVVSAFGHKSKMVYGMASYENKKAGEGVAVRELLEKMGLKDKTITLDALHCEKKL